MNIIIIYNSKSGFTKKYAEWISEALGCSTLPYDKFSGKTIDENDLFIFGSRIHAGKIEYISKIKQTFKNIPDKKLIVFATGATPIAAKDSIEQIWSDNFTGPELETTPHFYMQSGLNYEKMSFLDKTLMKAVSKLMQNKKEKSYVESGFGEAIKGSYDISSKEYTIPLLNLIKNNYDIG